MQSVSWANNSSEIIPSPGHIELLYQHHIPNTVGLIYQQILYPVYFWVYIDARVASRISARKVESVCRVQILIESVASTSN